MNTSPAMCAANRMAKALYEVLPAEKKPLIAKNIEALEAVQPVDLTAAQIGVRIGANWIPIDVYQKFMVETFGTSYYAGSRIKISCARLQTSDGPLPKRTLTGAISKP